MFSPVWIAELDLVCSERFSLLNMLPICCSMLIYPCTICFIQHAILKPLNIAAHSAWSSVVGLFTILISAVASSCTHRFVEHVLTFENLNINIHELLFSSILSIMHFFILSKSFTIVVPSHILYPGAFYTTSIKCLDYSKQVTASQKRAINLIGIQNGCHTCGTKYPLSENLLCKTIISIFGKSSSKPLYFADHSPPMAIACFYSRYKLKKLEGELLPQCPKCSYLQASCVKQVLKNPIYFKNNRHCIVTHAFTFRAWKIFLPWLYLMDSDYIARLHQYIYFSMDSFASFYCYYNTC